MNGFFNRLDGRSLIGVVLAMLSTAAFCADPLPDDSDVGGVFRGEVPGLGEVCLTLRASDEIVDARVSPQQHANRLRHASANVQLANDPLRWGTRGTLDEQGRWDLTLERNAVERKLNAKMKREVNGHIKGRLSDSKAEFIGSWRSTDSTDGEVEYPLRLPRIASWYLIEDTTRMRSGELGITWEFRGVVPQFTSEAQWLQEIHNQLREEVEAKALEFTTHGKLQDFSSLPENSSRGTRRHHCSADMAFSVSLLSDEIVSLDGYTSEYTGGAHANGGGISRNYWKRNDHAERFNLADLFKQNRTWLKHLAGLVMADLRRQEAPWIVAPPRPDLRVSELKADDLAVFTINRSGLNFEFSPYQVGPYSAGHFVVQIPWSELRDELRTDTPLSRLIGLKP